MTRHGLPVLRARDVEEAVVEPFLDAAVEDSHELLTDGRLRAAQTGEESGLQLGRQLTTAQCVVPAATGGDAQVRVALQLGGP